MRLYALVLDRWSRLRPKWKIGAVAVVVLAVGGVSAAGYRQWHYMQHDNRFCTSCHLMRDPFERFTRSAHAQLECHDCHKARIRDQLHQLYSTLVERPREIGRHADVPNQVCGACHIRGDSTRWRIIASTAGHRVHLESRTGALRGMRCVTCHGVTVHEFAPVDRTCGQAGCHALNTIRLGKMNQASELHCTTCHNFLAEARTVAVDSLGLPLTPAAAQCLGCHAMQQRVRDLEIGRDPHRGVCGDCHKPHRQQTPQEVDCTTAGCHAGWRAVSFHVGVPHPERCTSCHEPHSWRVEGENCLRCHHDVERERPTPPRQATRRSALLAPDAVADVASAAALAAILPAPPMGPAQDPSGLPRFSHGDHRRQPCGDCHSSRVRHGQLVVRTAEDCQRCHHGGARRDSCADCHAAAGLQPVADAPARQLRIAAARGAVARRIVFDHRRHTAVACARCHSEPLSRAPRGADCSSCHANHHQATADCVACHGAANALASHRAADHASCATASCHGERATALPATREACLVCHVAQTRHVPGRVCEQCHRVTAAARG